MSITKIVLKLMLVLFPLALASHLNLPLARAQGSGPEARKFDEFGDIQYSDLIARLDNFAIQLQNEPSVRGFIIVYRTRRDLPGLSNRYAMRSRNYLVKRRGIPSARVVTVDGGEANCLTQELWIVPVGAAPKPRSDAYSNSYIDPDTARKFDELYLGTAEDGWSAETEDMAANLDAFASALQKEPQAKAYLIAYDQYYIERGVAEYLGRGGRKYSRVYLDPRGTGWKILRAEREYLMSIYRLPASRIKLINGGYRSTRQVELWIVPRGASAPIPTPNRFPGRK